MSKRKPFRPTKADETREPYPIPPLEDWEAHLFLVADHFNVVRYAGPGRYDTRKFMTFPEAVLDVFRDPVQSHGREPLIYVVQQPPGNTTGRYFAMDRKDYRKYVDMWEASGSAQTVSRKRMIQLSARAKARLFEEGS